MMLRILLAATLALVPFLPTGNASHVECTNTPTGHEACGSVTVTCGAATASGAATGIVTWTLVVWSEFGSSSTSLRAPAAQLAARTVCGIPGCTYGYLYADGVLVTSDGLCWA